ncbi:MAG: host attachment protein [Pseudomonadota bacterium]
MQFPKSSTIAVTDGSHLRLFTNIGDELHLQLQEQPPPHLGSHTKGADRQAEEGSYAASVAALLNQQVLAGEIGQLYVVAPPRTLGELRKHYHPVLQVRLLGELGKEHTHDTPEVLHAALVKA